MAKISRKIQKEFNRFRGNHRYLCQAPFISMKISMDGMVSPCCYNVSLNDLYTRKSLKSVWDGSIFEEYRDNIRRNILPDACEKCEKALLNEEFSSVKIQQYDSFKIKRFKKKSPQLIELALSNVCNLECIMCSGANSSTIRKNRECLPPIKTLFNDKFRDEFYEFIPDLQEVVFAGGEPFLINIYFDLWEDIIRINPKCEMSIVTNGTVLNERVKEILDKGNFRINLSFDAITKETYERIRVNANFEQTMRNMEYFAELARSKNRRLHIPICPLRQNKMELPDLVRFCNDKDYSLNFVNVFRDVNNAMWGMSSVELLEIREYYLNQKFIHTNKNSLNNIAQFNDLISRIEQWANDAKNKENFRELYDLETSKVPELKTELFNYIDKGLRKLFFDEIQLKNNRSIIHSRFKELMDSLPDYFNSNHFYRQLLTNSDIAIVDVLLNHSLDSIMEIFHECFFYKGNY